MTEEEYTTPAADEINMLTALKKFKQFSGRSTRKEFWLFVLPLGNDGYLLSSKMDVGKLLDF